MSVVITPVDLITLTVGTDDISCQVTKHTISDADQGGGETVRTGCGDIVNIPADTTEVGTIDLSLFPERGDATFLAWTWAHAGETASFDFVVNPGTPTALQWTGELTVSAIPETQEEYTKQETVDVTWNVTQWLTRAVVPVP